MQKQIQQAGRYVHAGKFAHYTSLAVSKRAFSQNTLTTSMNTAKNHNLRVMSTPTWPVPYYQRSFRHPANLDKDLGDIGYIAMPLADSHMVVAKEMLKLQGKGYVVEAIEQHYDITDYRTKFEDSSKFSEAYTDDLLDCLNIAHEQNVKILAENDLSDVFN